MAPQVFSLIWLELEDEVRREPLGVAFDGPIEGFRFNAVDGGEVGIQDHLLAADGQDARIQAITGDYLPQKTVTECFAAYEGESLQLPKDAVLPDEKFLAVHRAKSFEKWV